MTLFGLLLLSMSPENKTKHKSGKLAKSAHTRATILHTSYMLQLYTLHTCGVDHIVDRKREPRHAVLVLVQDNGLRRNGVDLKRRPIAVSHGPHKVRVQCAVIRRGWPGACVEERQVHSVLCLCIGIGVHEAAVVYVLLVDCGGARGYGCLSQAASRCIKCLCTTGARTCIVSSSLVVHICSASTEAALTSLALVSSRVYQNCVRTTAQLATISRIPR